MKKSKAVPKTTRLNIPRALLDDLYSVVSVAVVVKLDCDKTVKTESFVHSAEERTLVKWM